MSTDNNYLYGKEEKNYGDKYQQHLFEQYKLYINGTEKISDRREGANKYFITINTTILTVLIIASKINVTKDIEYTYVLLPVLGITICIIFWFLLNSYRNINTGKFEVIHEIEKKLPLKLYDFEWKILKGGDDKSTYIPFSKIESLIPVAFGVVYFILLSINLHPYTSNIIYCLI